MTVALTSISIDIDRKEAAAQSSQSLSVPRPIKMGFNQIPAEVTENVFKFLSIKELGTIARVCKEWNRLSAENSLWLPLITDEERKAFRDQEGIPNHNIRQFVARHRNYEFRWIQAEAAQKKERNYLCLCGCYYFGTFCLNVATITFNSVLLQFKEDYSEQLKDLEPNRDLTPYSKNQYAYYQEHHMTTVDKNLAIASAVMGGAVLIGTVAKYCWPTSSIRKVATTACGVALIALGASAAPTWVTATTIACGTVIVANTLLPSAKGLFGRIKKCF